MPLQKGGRQKNYASTLENISKLRKNEKWGKKMLRDNFRQKGEMNKRNGNSNDTMKNNYENN